jgi:hypothetical protein
MKQTWANPNPAIVVGPDEKLPFNHITDVPEPMRVNALEARDFAIDSLTKRLRASELAEPEVEEVDARMRSLYDQLWAEYEHNHGVEHPVRHWQQATAASA